MERETSKEQIWPRTLLVSSPRGFCAGVVRAIEALWQFHRKNQHDNPDSKTYSYHQIIHNTHVVREFEEAGVVFVDNINEILEGGKVVFSAHGISPQVRQQAEKRNLVWVDATCPLVDKPHREVRRFAQAGYTILYIGHRGHDEAVGIMGEAPDNIILIQTAEDAENVKVADVTKVALVTQTTLSLDDSAQTRAILRRRFPQIVEPPKQDICYATQNRQDGVKEMIRRGAQVVVVVGSPNSSNSKRLAEVTQSLGARAYFVDEVGELARHEDEFPGTSVVGLTSGASAPESKFQEVIRWFKERGSQEIVEVVVEDESKIVFTPPRGL